MATGLTETLYSAVTAVTSGTVATGNNQHHTIHIISSAVTSGGTFQVKTSIDGTNYSINQVVPVTSNTVTEIVLSSRRYTHIAVPLTARTDGTYTVKYLGSMNFG